MEKNLLICGDNLKVLNNPIKIYALFSLSLLLIGMLSSCASTGLVKGKSLPAIQGDDYADLYFMREATGGTPYGVIIELNDERLFAFNRGECVYFPIPSGKIKLTAVTYAGEFIPGTPVKKVLEFNAERGESYFLFANYHMRWGVIDFDRLSCSGWLAKYHPSHFWIDLQNGNKIETLRVKCAEQEPPILQIGIDWREIVPER